MTDPTPQEYAAVIEGLREQLWKAEAELARYKAAVGGVRELHKRVEWNWLSVPVPSSWACENCYPTQREWPCLTIRTLDHALAASEGSHVIDEPLDEENEEALELTREDLLEKVKAGEPANLSSGVKVGEVTDVVIENCTTETEVSQGSEGSDDEV